MINYFEAAEKTLRARGLLETALGNLERKKERILRYGAPSEYPSADMSKPYTGAKSVNDALADCLELAEVMREIQITRDKVEEIDGVLAQMDEDDARILRLWYIERKSKDEITEAVCYSSTPYAVVVIECHADELKRNIVAICVEPLSALATVARDLSTNGLEFLAFGSLGLPAGG